MNLPRILTHTHNRFSLFMAGNWIDGTHPFAPISISSDGILHQDPTVITNFYTHGLIWPWFWWPTSKLLMVCTKKGSLRVNEILRHFQEWFLALFFPWIFCFRHFKNSDFMFSCEFTKILHWKETFKNSNILNFLKFMRPKR